MNDVIYKQCTGPCGRTLPATVEHFHKHTKQGLHPRCKECINIQKAEYRSRPEVKEHKKKQRKEYYNRTEVKKHVSDYGKEYRSDPETREHIRSYNKKYRSIPEVNERLTRQSKERYSRPKVKERVSNQGKLYRSRPEVKEHIREYHREYYSRPEVKEHNNFLRRAIDHNRRARKRLVSGTHTPEQIRDRMKRQKHKCYYCHKRFQKIKGKYIYHIEHTFPLKRVVGTNIPANSIDYLVLSCPFCNKSKGDKFPWEWPEGGRLL